MVGKPQVYGQTFVTPCHPLASVVLCYKGKLKFPLKWEKIECADPRCKQTFTAVLDSEPKWTHLGLPDPYPLRDRALWTVNLSEVQNWIDAGRPRLIPKEW